MREESAEFRKLLSDSAEVIHNATLKVQKLQEQAAGQAQEAGQEFEPELDPDTINKINRENAVTQAKIANMEAITAAEGINQEPRTWMPHEGSPFVSRPYVLQQLPDGKWVLIDPLASDIDLHPPIKNSWLIKYELPWYERDVNEQDPDGDKFSNLEEYQAGTDPRDKTSVPPYYTKLRLKKFISKPFRLMFTGSPDDGHTFTVNTLGDRKKATLFLELGQSIPGTPYIVRGYEKKNVTRNDMDVDASELTIENTESHQKIVLVANKEANDPTSFAEFFYIYDNGTFTVKKDEDFTLAPEPDRKYKLIDISEGEAVIKDLQTGEQHKIPLMQ